MQNSASAFQRTLDFLNKLSPLLWLVLGGLVTQLWTRFRSRTRRFLWTASHTQIAIAAGHPQLGNVTVLWNGQPVNHVHTTKVEFINDSNEDQKDVVVTLSFQGLGHIIRSDGVIEGVLGNIPFDSAYVAQYQGATPQQINLLNTLVVHRIPVFNRRQKATFTLVVVRDDASSPLIQASCNHPGFRIEYSPSVRMIWGVPIVPAARTGLAIGAFVVASLIRYFSASHSYAIPTLCWIVGLAAAPVGALSIKLWRATVRFVG